MTVSSDCRHRFEPLFDIHPVTGASIEVFYAVGLATFGRGGAGWFGGLASAASPQRAQRLARSLRAMERTGMRWEAAAQGRRNEQGKNAINYAPAASPALPRNGNDKAAFRRPVRTYSDIEKIWSGRRDSNPRPRPWQGRALPLSYTRIP